jgi:hypothetical protein
LRDGRPSVTLKGLQVTQTCNAATAFGNNYSRAIAVRSGAAQGSPVSPLLFVAAMQPLAARLRHLQAAGAIDGIRLPGGRLAPPS